MGARFGVDPPANTSTGAGSGLGSSPLDPHVKNPLGLDRLRPALPHLHLTTTLWLRKVIWEQGNNYAASPTCSCHLTCVPGGCGGGDLLTRIICSCCTCALPSAPSPRCPTTRLQLGISKPKTYTDGTIRWCIIATATEGPATVSEAL
jgi:hypothetical protein